MSRAAQPTVPTVPTMNKLYVAAFLGLGLTAGLQGCSTETTQELAPATSEAPQGLQTARFVLDEDP